MAKKILIFSAHCDDMETGMGGTTKLLIDAGYEVIVITTTLPPASKRYDNFGDVPAPEVRKEESRKSHAMLSIEPRFLDFSEELDFPVTKTERAKFKEIMDEVKPDIVFTQWGIDVNPDHRALCALSIEHCLQKGVNIELFCYEVFSDPGRPQSLGFYPTHYVNIDSVLEFKKELVMTQKSQSPNLWAGNLEIQALRAFEMSSDPFSKGVKNAEAFVRLTRYGDLFDELEEILNGTTFGLPAGMGVKVDPKAIGLQ